MIWSEGSTKDPMIWSAFSAPTRDAITLGLGFGQLEPVFALGSGQLPPPAGRKPV